MRLESTIRYSKSGSSDIAAKIRHQTPSMLRRLKRRNTLFQSPNTSGRSRQGEPVGTIQSTGVRANIARPSRSQDGFRDSVIHPTLALEATHAVLRPDRLGISRSAILS